jgi:hypothetical protein
MLASLLPQRGQQAKRGCLAIPADFTDGTYTGGASILTPARAYQHIRVLQQGIPHMESLF